MRGIADFTIRSVLPRGRGDPGYELIVDGSEGILFEPTAKMHHHGRIKEGFLLVFVQPEEVLEVVVFLDLLHSLFVRAPELFLDDECSKRDATAFRGCPHPGVGELFLVMLLDSFPGNDSRQLHPPIVSIHFAAEGKVEVDEFQLVRGSLLVHGQ